MADFEVADVLTDVIERLEVRSAWTQPLAFDLKSLVRGPTSPLVRKARPTFTLSGNALGKVVIAPYGEAPPQGGNGLVVAAIGGVVLLVGIGFVVGRASAPGGGGT